MRCWHTLLPCGPSFQAQWSFPPDVNTQAINKQMINVYPINAITSEVQQGMLGRSQATLSLGHEGFFVGVWAKVSRSHVCVRCTGRYVLHPSGLAGHRGKEDSSSWSELRWSTTWPHHPSNAHKHLHNLSTNFLQEPRLGSQSSVEAWEPTGTRVP